VAYLGAFSNSLVDDNPTLLQILLHGVYGADLTDSLWMSVSFFGISVALATPSAPASTHNANHDD